MECPYCGTELVYEDYYGRILPHQDGAIVGYIYYCPVGEEDGDCESSSFHVAGSFYTFNGNLEEGYPC